MGRDGVMYLFVPDPEIVDILGTVVPRENPLVTEGPPALRPTKYKLLKCIGQGPADDDDKVVYKREDVKIEFST